MKTFLWALLAAVSFSAGQAQAGCPPIELTSLGSTDSANPEAKPKLLTLDAYLKKHQIAGTVNKSTRKGALQPEPGSIDWDPCQAGGGEWVVYEVNTLERVYIEGSAVRENHTYAAIAGYDIERQLAINANSPPKDNSPSAPPPNQTIPKEERCENKRRQCIADAWEIAKRLEEGCEFRAFGKAVDIPFATAACKAGVYAAYMRQRDNKCMNVKSQCLTEP